MEPEKNIGKNNEWVNHLEQDHNCEFSVSNACRDKLVHLLNKIKTGEDLRPKKYHCN